MDLCIRVAEAAFARCSRYSAWVEAVEQAVEAVDEAVRCVSLPVDLGNEARAAEREPGEIRKGLEMLTEAGRHLKEVFSGRGYFNYDQSD